MHEAMKAARRAIAVSAREDRAAAGGARTWGAYQRYGNPFYRLFDAEALEEQMKPSNRSRPDI